MTSTKVHDGMLMNTEHNPFADPNAPTLAWVIDRLQTLEVCDVRDKRELCSALRTLARWFDLPPGAVPAHPAFVRERLARFHPVQTGVSARRVQNVRSLVLKAFRLAGVSVSAPSHMCPFSDAWQALYDQLPDRYPRWGLSRFMRYCSANRIEPAAVTNAVFDQFKVALVEESLVKHPVRDHQTACRAWNKARSEVEGWPDTEITVPRYQETYGVDWHTLDQGLASEIDAYIARLTAADLFDVDSPERPLRPESLRLVRGNIGRYLGALDAAGVGISEITSLNALVSFENFKAAIEWLWERNGRKTSEVISGLAWNIRCIAIKWCKVDDAAATAYARAMKKLRVEHKGLSDKNDALLRQFDDRELVRRLLGVPSTLWSEVERGHNRLGPVQAARMAQVAVAIEILQYAPMRMLNLTNLDLERHLNWNQSGDARVLHITIPANEVKNSERLHYPLPEDVSERVHEYIMRYRPSLTDGHNPHLFPGRNGKPKDQSCLSRQITRAVHKHAGVRVTPHQFRHIAAKLVLDRSPGCYETVRLLLGHKRTSTTYQLYCGHETQAAATLYHGTVLSLRGAD